MIFLLIVVAAAAAADPESMAQKKKHTQLTLMAECVCERKEKQTILFILYCLHTKRVDIVIPWTWFVK